MRLFAFSTVPFCHGALGSQNQLLAPIPSSRQMRAMIRAQSPVNKTDRNDARGIAAMMRVGLYRPVHVKTVRSQKIRMLLTHRKILQAKAIDIENDLRGTLRNFGLKIGIARGASFEPRVKELVERMPDLAASIEPLLVVRRALREQLTVLHRQVLALARDNELVRRLMTVPGAGPIVALAFIACIDTPARFAKSKSVGAALGLTPSQYQSGEVQRQGKISCCGDDMMRTLLYESCAVHAVSVAEMVVVESLGDEDREASRREKSHRGPGAAPSCRPAPDVGKRYRLPVLTERCGHIGIKA
jgi:transposase